MNAKVIENPRLSVIPAPDLSDKLCRALWQVVWGTLYRCSPTPFYGWRRFLLRIFGARVEPGARAYPSARIWAPWNLEMETGSCLGPGVDCYSVHKVILRRNSTVSQRAFLCAASRDVHHSSRRLLAGTIEVSPNAWIAAEAYVGPGVYVGSASVVAARAVVSRHVVEGVIVAGNPARVVGTTGERRQASQFCQPKTTDMPDEG